METDLGLAVRRRTAWALATLGLTLAACSNGAPAPAPASVQVETSALTSCTSNANCNAGQTCCSGVCKSLVSMGATGTLEYGCYAGQKPDDGSPVPPATNKVPDFSFAGYRRGGVAIPTAPQLGTTLSPAGGSANDAATIQARLDSAAVQAATVGYSVAIVLTTGTFNIDTPLRIPSGVVLRGAGQGSAGTILMSRINSAHSLVAIGPATPIDYPTETSAQTPIVSSYVAVGSNELVVNGGAPWLNADVVVVRTPNQDWVKDIHMDHIGSDPPWVPADFAIKHPRHVVATQLVTGGIKLTLDIPIVDAIDTNYGGGYVAKIAAGAFVEESGVEDLRIDAQFEDTSTEDGQWNGISFERARNCWARRVTVKRYGMSAAVMGDGSSFNTVEEVAHLSPKSPLNDNGLPHSGHRYSFHVASGVGNLFQRCYTYDARHSFVTGQKVTGPHVWLDSVALNANADQGPHFKWATGLLYDNIHSEESVLAEQVFPNGGGVRVHNAFTGGTSHGWTGAQVMIWNCEAPLVCDAPGGAMNWVVGGIGHRNESTSTPDEPFGIWQLNTTTVKPRSLYLQQLKDRFGAQGQAALDAVATPQQQKGRLFKAIMKWKGEGKLSAYADDPSCVTGTPDAASAACCPKSCAKCGGSGVPSECLANPILSGTRSCLEFGPPCYRPDPTCMWGTKFANGGCCPTGCSQCGGSNCPSGCCIGSRTCGAQPAPCKLIDPQCLSGVEGLSITQASDGSEVIHDYCCGPDCTQCGGPGCGGAGNGCCIGSITAACSGTMPPCQVN